MNTAIIINLDYEAFPIVKCRKIWGLIEKGMADAGFLKNNRLFITNANPEVAFEKARDVLHQVEDDCRADGEDFQSCIREFYGIPHSQIVDLSLPSAHEITVDFIASGTFQSLFPGQ